MEVAGSNPAAGRKISAIFRGIKVPLGPTASRQYGALQEEGKRQGTTPPRVTGRSAENGGVLDQISHRPVTHMTPVMTGHDTEVTGLMGLMISDVAIRQPRHRDAALAVRVTESQLATGIRTARAFSYRPSYKPNMNGSYTRSGVASVSPIRRFSFSRTSVSLQVAGPVHVSRASDMTQKKIRPN